MHNQRIETQQQFSTLPLIEIIMLGSFDKNSYYNTMKINAHIESFQIAYLS